ncbi:MAG: hypothetical protein WC979_03365 [Candidatus Pacearchaeota archaeon]|nr:hypothetical protein [Clostridia bacterium]
MNPGSTAHADDIVGIHYNIKGPRSYTERIEYLKKKRLAVYAKGFHFYKTIRRAIDSGIQKEYVIVECTIPKGSQVYYDETDLGVANKITINKILPTVITDINY